MNRDRVGSKHQSQKLEDPPEGKEDNSLNRQELPHWVDWLQQIMCALIEVDETVQGHLTT